MDIEYNRTHQRTRWMLTQMLTIIFAVTREIIFRIDRIKEEQRCRLVFFTLNRLSDAFTTLFLNMRPLDRIVRLNIYYGVLDARLFLNTFDRKRLGVTWPDFSGHIRRLSYTVWTSRKAVSSSWTPSTLFFFLLESSHVYPTNICEVESFLYKQSVWDARKPFFWLHFMFEMKDLHPLRNSRWRHKCYFFFRWKSTSIKKAECLETSNF